MPRWWNRLRGIVGKRTRRLKKVIARWRSPPKAQPPARVSIAARAFQTPASHYLIEKTDKWHYMELHPQPVNGRRHFSPSVSPLPHLVLRDAHGVARFTLSYRLRDGEIQLEEIQRCRTMEWLSMHETPSSHAMRETRASKEFQSQLNGVHPTEFLLIQFLYRHRAEILAGKKMAWRWSVYDDYFPANNIANQLYPMLAKHYFKRVPGSRGKAEESYIARWELDLNKLRTREALGLPPVPKKKK